MFIVILGDGLTIRLTARFSSNGILTTCINNRLPVMPLVFGMIIRPFESLDNPSS